MKRPTLSSKRRLLFASAGALALATGLWSCGGLQTISRQEFLTFAESQNECQTVDECMIVKASDCVCPVVINENKYPVVFDKAEHLWCGIKVECSSILSVACLGGRCEVTAYGTLEGLPDGGR